MVSKTVTAALVVLAMSGAAGAQERSWAHRLNHVLERLDETASRYRDRALRFTCDESVHHYSHQGRQDYRHRYFYVNREDRGLVDFRLPLRGRSTAPVDLATLRLPYAVERAYSWIFIYQHSRRPFYRHELLGVEDVLGRPAFKLRSEPLEPFRKDLNEWFLTAWVDLETYQLLRVEALEVQDHRNKQRYEELLRDAKPEPRWLAFTEVTTEFGVEARGLRFPSQVISTRSSHQVPGEFSRRGYRIFLIRQAYRNYRFFDVATDERIGAADRAWLAEGPPPAESEPATVEPRLDAWVQSLVDELLPPQPAPPAPLPLVVVAVDEEDVVEEAHEPVSAFDAEPAARVEFRQPTAKDLAYGETRIEVAAADERISRVLVHLDEFPRPICDLRERPYRCRFDAGTSFQGRTLVARALDPDGQPLGTSVVRTLGFPEPEVVTRRSLIVPVVASWAERPPDLAALELDCVYAQKPCTVVGERRLSESTRFPVSLEVLVDVSGSVEVKRVEIEQALNYVIDSAQVGVEIAISEFSQVYRRISRFTSDKEELRLAVQNLTVGNRGTCLMQAMRHSLATLHHRAGHKLLLVISDGAETCRLRNFMVDDGRNGRVVQYDWDSKSRTLGFYVDPDALSDTVDLARAVGVPVYVFRLDRDEGTVRYGIRFKFSRAWEGIAVETGGRVFAHGDVYGLRAALRDVVDDLESTWLLDVDLPAVQDLERKRRLELAVSGEAGIRLRFPEYWEPRSRIASLTALLASAEPGQRHWAASELSGVYDRALMRPLLRALRHETDERCHRAELETINRLTASLLLHGDLEDQKTAVAAVEQLRRLDPRLLDRLVPALGVYPKTAPPSRLARRVERLVARWP